MDRPHIVKEYIENQVTYLMRVKNIDRETAESFVKSIAKETYKAPKLKVIKTVREGYEETKDINFTEFMTSVKDNILCPNGRIYVNPKHRPARIREYIKDLLKRRKFHKNKMFQHQQKEEYEAAAMEKSNESRIKIDANTVCGGAKNSPYSCFYDKAGFNAVTSVARLMIKTNYTLLEQIFGGNYYWVDKEELIQNIILRIRTCPNKETIDALVNKYNLFKPTRTDLINRYQFFMNLYAVGPSYLNRAKITDLDQGSYINCYLESDIIKQLKSNSNLYLEEDIIVDLTDVITLVNKLEDHEVLFLYYVNNLRALFWKNSSYFKKLFFNLSNNITDKISNSCNESDIFKLDDDFPAIIATKFANLVKGQELSEVIKKDPELTKVFIQYVNYLFSEIQHIDELLKTFIRTEITVTRTKIKEDMWRNTTLGSDTDSVIYTLKEWLKWYKGDVFNEDEDNDTFLAIISYFVAKVSQHNMRVFSEHLGSVDEDRFILQMKGEYDFNSMIFYLIKKHYTGVMTIQEGRVLPKIKLDIKGIGLRNSAVPKITADELKATVIETQTQQSASKYIRNVINLELEMSKDLRSGSTQFLKIISVKNKEQYANSGSSAYLYLELWNETFGDKYGYVYTPVKCPNVFLLSINDETLSYVRKIDEEIYRRLKNFKSRYPKRDLTNIIINPLLHKIPEEIIVMMDFRKHIYTNMKPMYLTLESFGIFMMHSAKKLLLLSDYYNEVDLHLLDSHIEEEEKE